LLVVILTILLAK